MISDCGYMVGPDRIKPYNDVATRLGGLYTCIGSDWNNELADSATLCGAVALSASGTRATSGSRLRKNNKLSGGIQTTMEYEEFDEATVMYILCVFHCLFHYLLCRLLPLPGEIPSQIS